WLARHGLSLAFSTYQTNRLFLVGVASSGRLAVNERLFDKPMGLCLQEGRLTMACRYQIWHLENRLAPGELHRDADQLFVPCRSDTTGDLNVHDLAWTSEGALVFVNTDFSCLATLRPGFSFAPVWQPPFITRLAAEDRCHLNGLALQDGEPAYVTACSRTDAPAGWRHHRSDGGVVLHVPSGEVAASGLSMPHSPRWHQGRLWLLNSGTGELGCLDAGRFQPLARLPGFVRGLAFAGDCAVVGLSKLRSSSFSGLPLETWLADSGQSARCGLAVVDLRTGAVQETLQIDGVVEELFDVVALPGVRRPRALGFQDEDIERLISFPGSGGLCTTKPTVQRPARGRTAPTPGLPRTVEAPAAGAGVGAVRFQQVFHLSPDTLRPYDALLASGLLERWQTHPPTGELLAVSASIDGQLLGLALAQRSPPGDATPSATLLSIGTLPPCDTPEIKQTLCNHLERLAAAPLRR
ncbi:MAG: TIGR03032 family protein, partial [Rhodoferax sp.]|nr:TIGR03032 family protein [Rhodoferax sp.]